MSATKTILKVGKYTAKRHEDLLNSGSKHSHRGTYCVVCGKPVKLDTCLTFWTTHAESEKGEVIEIYEEYDLCIIENGGGGTDIMVGRDCAKHIVWSDRELTADEIKEIEEYKAQ